MALLLFLVGWFVSLCVRYALNNAGDACACILAGTSLLSVFDFLLTNDTEMNVLSVGACGIHGLVKQ